MTIEINTLHTLQSLDIKIITKKQNNVGQWGAGLERAECWVRQKRKCLQQSTLQDQDN